jgi:5-methylcytosine-specific restriction endonuclease McrA
MSTTYISAELRRSVVDRADRICEYCRIHEDDTFFGCHIDHVISEKHGGATEADNLALACTFCNLHKGSDISSLTADQVLTRFFNPRTDRWSEHFALVGTIIEPLTPIGEVTARIFEFNSSERLLERQALIAVGRYPRAES